MPTSFAIRATPRSFHLCSCTNTARRDLRRSNNNTARRGGRTAPIRNRLLFPSSSSSSSYYHVGMTSQRQTTRSFATVSTVLNPNRRSRSRACCRSFSGSGNGNHDSEQDCELADTVAYALMTESDERNNEEDNRNNNENTKTITKRTRIGWDDRIGLQKRWSNGAKGWNVRVDWQTTPHGIGLFAQQDIPAGALLRTGRIDTNLMQFTCTDDLRRFLEVTDRGGALGDADLDLGVRKDDADGDDEYRSRLLYLKDYLWGFNPMADERGYTHETTTSAANTGDGDGNENGPWFYGMWIPGNGLNHSDEPNTVYRPYYDRSRGEDAASDASGGSPSLAGIDLYALRDIRAGEELYDDYNRHGAAPDWIEGFLLRRRNATTLNFPGCNDFVVNKKGDSNGACQKEGTQAKRDSRDR